MIIISDLIQASKTEKEFTTETQRALRTQRKIKEYNL